MDIVYMYVMLYVSVYDFCHLNKSEDCALHELPSTISLGESFYPVQALPKFRAKVLVELLFLTWNSLPYPLPNVYNPANTQDLSHIPPPFFKKKKKTANFRERGREGEREGEKHQLVACLTPSTGELACNPGMCADQELNL